MEVFQFFLESLAVKAKIKGVFSRSCCYHGIKLSHENNMVTNDWVVFWYHDYSINWWKVLKSKSLKLFWATLLSTHVESWKKKSVLFTVRGKEKKKLVLVLQFLLQNKQDNLYVMALWKHEKQFVLLACKNVCLLQGVTNNTSSFPNFLLNFMCH